MVFFLFQIRQCTHLSTLYFLLVCLIFLMRQCIIAWFVYSFLWMVFSFQPSGVDRGFLVPYWLGYDTTPIYSCGSIDCVFVFPTTAVYISFFFVLFCRFHMIFLLIIYLWRRKKYWQTFLWLLLYFHFTEYYVVRGEWEVIALKRSQSITVLKVQKPLLK